VTGSSRPCRRRAVPQAGPSRRRGRRAVPRTGSSRRHAHPPTRLSRRWNPVRPARPTVALWVWVGVPGAGGVKAGADGGAPGVPRDGWPQAVRPAPDAPPGDGPWYGEAAGWLGGAAGPWAAGPTGDGVPPGPWFGTAAPGYGGWAGGPAGPYGPPGEADGPPGGRYEPPTPPPGPGVGNGGKPGRFGVADRGLAQRWGTTRVASIATASTADIPPVGAVSANSVPRKKSGSRSSCDEKSSTAQAVIARWNSPTTAGPIGEIRETRSTATSRPATVSRTAPRATWPKSSSWIPLLNRTTPTPVRIHSSGALISPRSSEPRCRTPRLLTVVSTHPSRGRQTLASPQVRGGPPATRPGSSVRGVPARRVVPPAAGRPGPGRTRPPDLAAR
jgi:hypothetical protein